MRRRARAWFIVSCASLAVVDAQSSSPTPSSSASQATDSNTKVHEYLNFDVRLINTDVSDQFFSTTTDDDGAGGVNDFACDFGCVDSAEVTLEFCDARVAYSFCKRGDPTTLDASSSDQDAVDMMERAVRKQYLNLMRAFALRGFEPDAGCRATLRRWFCYEYFNRCTVDETKFMPTCRSVCEQIKKDCGEANSAFVDCDVEYESFDMSGSTPPTFYTGGTYVNGTYVNTEEGKASGSYITGTKPNGENGTLVFELASGKCTGAAAFASTRGAFIVAVSLFLLAID